MAEFKVLLGLQLKSGEIQKISNQIKNTKFKQINLELNKKKIDSQLNSIRKQIQNLSKMKINLNLGTGVGSVSGIQNATRGLTQLGNTATTTQSKLRRIKMKVDTSGLKNDLSRLETEARKLNGVYDKLEASMRELKNAKLALESARGTGDNIADVNQLIAAYERYEKALKDVNNQLQINNRQKTSQYNKTNIDLQKQALSMDIDKYLKENTAAATQFGAKLRDIQSRIAACDAQGLRNLRAELRNVKTQADLAGKATKTFGDQLRTQISKYSTYFSVASVFMYATMALRDMFQQVVAIDSAMTELKKVTNETSAAYNNFLDNAAERASKIGTTIDGLVQSTADFARLGYGFKDSQELAEVANIYTVVGDEIDGVETATQSLISTMTAFKEQAGDMTDGDFAMSIVDKYNEVSNNFAISSGGIGEALQRSASSMAAANNTLDETIALITAANTVVQDPDSVGRFCRH